MKAAPKLPRALLHLIMEHEGVCAKAYICPAGLLTIGCGHVITKRDRAAGLHKRTLMKQEIIDLLERDIQARIPQVLNLVEQANPNQFGAILSFLFNVGSGNFRSSTLRRLHNQDEIDAAAEEFPKWRRGGGRILAGLVRRREDERALYLKIAPGRSQEQTGGLCASCGR